MRRYYLPKYLSTKTEQKIKGKEKDKNNKISEKKNNKERRNGRQLILKKKHSHINLHNCIDALKRKNGEQSY